MTCRPLLPALLAMLALGCSDDPQTPTVDSGLDQRVSLDARPDRAAAQDGLRDIARPDQRRQDTTVVKPDQTPTPDAPRPQKMRIHFKKPSSWKQVYLHTWKTWPANNQTKWPGTKMTAGANGWYSLDLSPQTSAGMVFNDSGSQQTIDLYRVGGGYFVITGKTSGKLADGKSTQVKSVGRWHEQNPEIYPPISVYPAGGTFFGSSIEVELSVEGAGVTERRYTSDGSSPLLGTTFTNGQRITIGRGTSTGGSVTLRVYAKTSGGGHEQRFVFAKKTGTTTPVWNPSNKPDSVSQNGRWVNLKNFNNDKGLGKRDVTIYLPADYATNSKRRYRVVYFHDGQNLFSPSTATFGQEWMVDENYDELVAEGLVDPAIFVGIHSASDSNTRTFEYVGGCNLGDGKPKYAAWLTQSLKPYIDRHYRTRSQAPFTHTMGSSFGGIISFYLSWNHPGVFGHAACVSTAFKCAGTQMLTDLRAYKGGKKSVRYWIDGGYKEGTPYTTGRTSYVSTNRQFAEKLGSLGWREDLDLGLQEVVGGEHNETHWSRRIKQVLYFMLRRAAPRITHIEARTALSAIKVGDSTYASLDIRYENGPLVTKIYNDKTNPATITTNPAGVVTVDPNTGLVSGKKAGKATITMKYKGFSASSVVTVQ